MKETGVEGHLVKRVKALGGIALKGDIPGCRFLDRICILPDGVTLWVECKRPDGGRRTRLQENTIQALLELGHFAFLVKSKAEIDLILDGPRVWHDDELFVSDPADRFRFFTSTPSGLKRFPVAGDKTGEEVGIDEVNMETLDGWHP